MLRGSTFCRRSSRTLSRREEVLVAEASSSLSLGFGLEMMSFVHTLSFVRLLLQ